MKPKINLNPKSNLQWKTQQLRTQNQTFNKKPINPNPNRSRRCHHCHGEPAASLLMESLLLPLEKRETSARQLRQRIDQKIKNEGKGTWERK